MSNRKQRRAAASTRPEATKTAVEQVQEADKAADEVQPAPEGDTKRIPINHPDDGRTYKPGSVIVNNTLVEPGSGIDDTAKKLEALDAADAKRAALPHVDPAMSGHVNTGADLPMADDAATALAVTEPAPPWPPTDATAFLSKLNELTLDMSDEERRMLANMIVPLLPPASVVVPVVELSDEGRRQFGLAAAIVEDNKLDEPEPVNLTPGYVPPELVEKMKANDEKERRDAIESASAKDQAMQAEARERKLNLRDAIETCLMRHERGTEAVSAGRATCGDMDAMALHNQRLDWLKRLDLANDIEVLRALYLDIDAVEFIYASGEVDDGGENGVTV